MATTLTTDVALARVNAGLTSKSDKDLKAGGVEGAAQDSSINLTQDDSDDESNEGVKYDPPALVTKYEDYSNDDENDNGGEESLVDAIDITDDGRRYPTCRRMEPDFTIPLSKGPTHSSSRQMSEGVVSAQIESKQMSKTQTDEYIVGIVFAQHFNLKKGLELFGDAADVAVKKELSQIHELSTYEPLALSELTSQEIKDALESLMFITDKRNGNIKARKVADGSKCRTYAGYENSDGSSPTVATDSIFLTGVVDARERRDIAILDIVNAFLHATNDEKVLMLLRGKLAEMMVAVDSKLYRKYVTYTSKGVPMLYVCLSKALYGMLRAALQFYKRLRSDLENMGFVVNMHDPCVSNKMVNRYQMSVCWHVDDLKFSHVDENAVTAFALKLARLYVPKTTISRRKIHDYLGMDMGWGTNPGTMMVSMVKYLAKVVKEFPEVLTSTKGSPAAYHLFKIREDRKKLPEELARQFHRTTDQLLFLCKRA